MFDLRLYGIRLMVKDHSDSVRENLLLPLYGLLSNQQQGIFYIRHPTDRIIHTISFVTSVMEQWLEPLGFSLIRRKEGNVLFNDALNTFYLRLYGVRYMVKNQSDMERGNPLPPHRLLFSISSKCSFICIIPQTG